MRRRLDRRRRSSSIGGLREPCCRGRRRLRRRTHRPDFRLDLFVRWGWRMQGRRRFLLPESRPPSGSLLPRVRSMPGLPLRTPTGRQGRLRNGAKDNLNLDFVQVLIAKFDDLVKSFLPDVRLGLIKSQIVALDNGTPYRSLPRSVTLDTFLERNIKKEHHAGNPKSLCQFKVFPPMGRDERRRIHHTEPVQAQSQFREVVHESERLGLKTLIALVVAHSSPRPVGRNDLRGTKVTLRESGLSASRGSTKQNDRRTDQPHSLLLALICCLFLSHSRHDRSLRDLAACRRSSWTTKELGLQDSPESPSTQKSMILPLGEGLLFVF